MAACAFQLTKELSSAGTVGVIALVAIVVLPIALVHIGRAPVYLFAFYAALVPFIDLLPSTGGTTITKVIAILAGGMLILSIITKKRIVKPPRSLFAVLLFVAYAGASTFWAIDPNVAVQAFAIELNLVLLFAVISVYPATRKDFYIVLAGAFAGSMAIAIYGVYSYFTMSPDDLRLSVGESMGHILDPNYYATSLLLPMAIALVMFLRPNRLAVKVLWGLISATMFSGLALSGSRGAVIAFAVMLIFLAWRLPYRIQLSAVVLGAIAAIVGSAAGARFMSADAASGDLRFDVWKVGIASLHQYWLAGAGIGNFPNAFAQYFLSTPHQAIPWDRMAHSTLVQSLVEYGILGFFIVIAVWYVVFRDVAHVRGDRFAADMSIALSAGVLAYFVGGISLDMMHLKFTWLAFELVVLWRASLITSGIDVDAKNAPEMEPRSDMARAPTIA